MPERAFIAIGSNIEPEKHLPLAVDRLSKLGSLVATSRVYENPAVGDGLQPDFINVAALVLTCLQPLEVRQKLRAIEASLGRVRTQDPYAARTIDLDLCLFGSAVINTPDLTLPDPEITERAYLAVTLAELAPDMLHPVTGERLADLAERLRQSTRLIFRTDVALVG